MEEKRAPPPPSPGCAPEHAQCASSRHRPSAETSRGGLLGPRVTAAGGGGEGSLWGYGKRRLQSRRARKGHPRSADRGGCFWVRRDGLPWDPWPVPLVLPHPAADSGTRRVCLARGRGHGQPVSLGGPTPSPAPGRRLPYSAFSANFPFQNRKAKAMGPGHLATGSFCSPLSLLCCWPWFTQANFLWLTLSASFDLPQVP